MWLWWITEINSRYRRHLLDFEHFEWWKRNRAKEPTRKRYAMRWNDGKGSRMRAGASEFGLMIIKVENINMQYLLMSAHYNANVRTMFMCGLLFWVVAFYTEKKTFVIYAPKAQIHTDAKENREWERKGEKVRTNGFWFSIEYDNTFSFFERAKVTINDTRTQTQMKSMANNKNKLYQIYHPWAHHLH